MKEELKPIYKDKEHTSTTILDGNGFDPKQIPALLKSFVLHQWNSQQVNDDGKIASEDVEILDYAYHKAEPNKYTVTVRWKFSF